MLNMLLPFRTIVLTTSMLVGVNMESIKNQPQSVIILKNPRSGSSYFVTLSLNEDGTFSWEGLVSLNGLWQNGNNEFDFIGTWSITEDILTIISGENTFIYECTLNEGDLRLEIEYTVDDKSTEVQFYFTKL